MIIVIRISGLVGLSKKLQETLHRIRLRRKYSAVLLQPTKENLKLLKIIRNYVAYGDIDDPTLTALVETRAIFKPTTKKPDTKTIIDQINKKTHNHWDIKPFFRLHSPRGGIDSKKHYGTTRQAVLGDNKKDINKLVRRML
jgi:large subunit ribosomal protein L30